MNDITTEEIDQLLAKAFSQSRDQQPSVKQFLAATHTITKEMKKRIARGDVSSFRVEYIGSNRLEISSSTAFTSNNLLPMTITLHEAYEIK